MAYTEKLSNGRWRGGYRDEYGRRRTKVFDLKRDAQEWGNEPVLLHEARPRETKLM